MTHARVGWVRAHAGRGILQRQRIFRVESALPQRSPPMPSLPLSPHRNRRTPVRSPARAALGALALCALLLPQAASAQEYTAARKAGRGVAGMTMGVLEVPGNVVQETRAN